jgi:maltose O-acetyltransferase
MNPCTKTLKGRIRYRASRLLLTISEEAARWSIPAEDSVLRRRLLKMIGLKLGKPVFLDTGLAFEYGHNIEIGPYTFLRQNAYLGDWDRIRIGTGTSIARNLSIYTGFHDQRDFSPSGAPVTIGDFCWIAAGVTILPGVTIGNDCIIGAHSLVAHNVPDGAVACGNPARIVSKREDLPDRLHTGFGYLSRSTRQPA